MSEQTRKAGLYSKQLDVALAALDHIKKHPSASSAVRSEVVVAIARMRMLEKRSDSVSSGFGKRKTTQDHQ